MDELVKSGIPNKNDELIGSIVKLRKFAPVVDLHWAEALQEERNSVLVDNYIVTEELAGHFETILESFTLKRHERKILRFGDIVDAATLQRSHILRGQYGTGKSYFLLMVSGLLEALSNEGLYDELTDKFRMFAGIRHHMDILRENAKKYLVVRIDGVKNIDVRFSELVQKNVISKIKRVLGEHEISDSYSIALQKLDEYRKDPVLSELLDEELRNRSLSYGSLVQGLSASERKSLKEYRDVMQKITKHNIDEGFDSMEAFLRSASLHVKKHGWSGIVILFDEFSAYVNASIEDRRITGDLAAIQSLAQLTVPREEQDLFFICSMHIDIGRILGNIMAAAEEIQKVRGRFSEMTISFNNSGNLVENILAVNSEKFAAIQRKYSRYFGALPHRFPKMERVYPIHPFTVNSIIKVSGKFAQSERTIFSFFAEAVNKKLSEPVVKDERLNLITVREIYDYFIDYISERDLALKDSALRCMAFCKKELDKDIVKALVVAHVSVGEGSDSRLTPRDIAFILGIDDIQAVDMFLKELSSNPASNIIFYEKEYKFEFISAGNAAAELCSKIDQDAANMSSYDALLDVLDEYGTAISIRKSYVVNPSRDILPVRKEIAGVIFRPADLLKSIDFEMVNHKKDGKILFVIPDFHDEIGRDYVDIVKERLLKAEANICAAVPKSFPVSLEKDLKYYAVLKNLIRSAGNDENGRKTVQKMLQSAQKVVEHEIRKFGDISNFTFIFNENKVTDGFTSIEELEKYMLLRYFSRFPRTDVEIVRSKNSIHTLVDNFLVFGEKSNIPANYTSETDKLVMDVLRPLDLVKVERSGSGYSARLKIPEEVNNPESFEIWNIVNDTSRTLKDMFDVLERAPYGLPDFMVELYIAAAVAANRLTIKYRGQYVQLNKSSIALINSGGYSLEKIETASQELKNKVKKVWTAFEKIHGRCGARSFEPGMPQSDADISMQVSGEMTDVGVILDGFEARLENINIKCNTLMDLMKVLLETVSVKNPVSFLEAFSRLPERVLGNDDSEPALERFERFLEFLAAVNRHLDTLRQIDSGLSELRCVEGIDEGYEDLKTMYYDAAGAFEKIREELRRNEFRPEMLMELKNNLLKLIHKYNEAFGAAHEIVNNTIRNLHEAFNSPRSPLGNTL